MFDNGLDGWLIFRFLSWPNLPIHLNNYLSCARAVGGWLAKTLPIDMFNRSCSRDSDSDALKCHPEDRPSTWCNHVTFIIDDASLEPLSFIIKNSHFVLPFCRM